MLAVINRQFPELDGLVGAQPLSAESEAALRQLTLQRLMAYGVEYGDAVRVRAAATAGTPWQSACAAVAESLLHDTSLLRSCETQSTQKQRCARVSALLRMSQMMMQADSDERRTLYRCAADYFRRAQSAGGGYRRVLVPCADGPLVGWHRPDAAGSYARTVLVVGGIEGWAMDLEPMARGWAERGIATLLLDAPGQGESRLEHDTYFNFNWKRALASVVDLVTGTMGAQSVGILGNSMGGTLAMHFAAFDARIVACCNNGGLRVPLSQKQRTNFFPKMLAFCSPAASEDAESVWASVEVLPDSLRSQAPLLIVQGEADPLVSIKDSRQMLEWSAASDKQMHVFAKADHCVYDQPADRDNLIADWFACRL